MLKGKNSFFIKYNNSNFFMALFDTALDTELQNVVNNIPIPSQLIKKLMVKLKLDSSEDILFVRKKKLAFFSLSLKNR